jgi:hypothetical protein
MIAADQPAPGVEDSVSEPVMSAQKTAESPAVVDDTVSAQVDPLDDEQFVAFVTDCLTLIVAHDGTQRRRETTSSFIGSPSRSPLPSPS